MVRRLVIELILFMLPFAAHRLYMLLPGERKGAPFWVLGMAGFALAAGGLLWVAASHPSDLGKCYQAAHYEAGIYTEGSKRDCNDVENPAPRDRK